MPDIPKPQQLTADDLKSRFMQACELQEANSQHDALLIYDELLQFIPDSPMIHFNMGLARFDVGDFDKAAEHYDIASIASPDDPDIQYNRGLNFRRLGKQKEATIAFAKAVELGDSSIDTLYNMALSHQDLKEFDEAAKLYEFILEIDKNHISSLNNFAYLCHKTDDLKKAEELYKRLLHLNPQHEAAKHMLNALLGLTPDEAPLDYIESIFDGYAETFEDSLLNNLRYRTPTELWRLFQEIVPSPHRYNCLDLGCGTGLAGEAFNSVCSSITGIDISDKILQVAKEKNLYKLLLKNDILSFMEDSREFFSLIIAADVFAYMGDLGSLFLACYQRCETDGIFCFSVEESKGDAYSLKKTGRYGHTTKYIEKVCKNTGWKLLSVERSKLRQDKNEWIFGYLFIFQK